MKFKLKICETNEHGEKNCWFENYDEPIKNPEEWGKEIIERFNSTLKPYEKAREYAGFEIIDVNQNEKHQWQKTNLTTLKDSYGFLDKYVCYECGITGKRRGLTSNVKRDHQFRGVVYTRCDTAKKHMNAKTNKGT